MADSEIEPVVYIPTAKRSMSSATEDDLNDFLQRKFPYGSLEQRRQLLDARLNRFYLTIDEAFADRVQNQVKSKSMTHAELVMLDKISQEDDFQFAFGVRYIGCSKPSCYLCDLYMKHHPLKLDHGPCHGNIFSNWCRPSGTHEEVEVLKKMTDSMRQDFEAQLAVDVSDLESAFDSITGLSASTVS